MIDKLGRCPNCNQNWDDGDTLTNLNKMDIFTHKLPADMLKIAAGLGYTETNKNKFSRVKVHERDRVILYECPNMRCGHVFNSETGEEYNSMYDYGRKEKSEKVKVYTSEDLGNIHTELIDKEDDCPFDVDNRPTKKYVEPKFPFEVDSILDHMAKTPKLILLDVKEEENAKEKPKDDTDNGGINTGNSPQKGRWGR